MTEDEIKEGIAEALNQETDISLEVRLARYFYKKGKSEALDKAVKWLYDNRDNVLTEDDSIKGKIPIRLILEFRKATED